jgi:NAD(P)-dependent dehydrogenase (short-subunit alcohol dehydrogenase family)
MARLEAKVAVITGAASGIGEATARLFAFERAAVVLADINDERGEKLAEEIRASGGNARYVHADVAREADVKAMIDVAVSEHGCLDVLFNNAGYGGTSGPIAEIPVEEFDATVGVLLRGVFLGIKHAAPAMCEKRSGSIINTSSVAGLRAGYAPHVYSVAKAAVIQLTRTVAMELGESGVRVNCICPGGVNTPMTGGTFETPQAQERARRTVPLGRYAQPEDIADVAVFLLGDDARHLTGSTLAVEGGATIA